MQEQLVSILTPCYNTAKYINRLLDSVLNQDYPYVEMICVDDGSKDNTKEVIESYMPKFVDKGYLLSCIYQNNGGQSTAINLGLKFIHGEYLIWPDSDDYYCEVDVLSKMVNRLKNSDEYGVIRCLSKYVDEKTLKPTHYADKITASSKEDLFEDCLFSQNGFLWGAGNYMIKTSVLDKVNPTRSIYTEKSAGQNWQMLLPIFYVSKCLTIPEYMHCILEREDSHCRGQFKGPDQQIAKVQSYENTILNTLKNINIIDDERLSTYIKRVQNKYKVEKIKIYLNYDWVESAKEMINELDESAVPISPMLRLRYKVALVPFGKYINYILERLPI